MKSKTYLILGATGFIGSHLVEAVVSKGNQVISFSTSPAGEKKVEHVQGDIRNLVILTKLLKRKPEVIVCLAAISGQTHTDRYPRLSWEVNVRAYMNLLDAVVHYSPQSRIIFSSSRLEYGRPQYLPVDELHTTAPVSLYGIHKHIISDYCQFLYRKFRLATVVLRTSNPYGSHHKSAKIYYNVINFFLDQARRDRELPIFGKGLQKRDYLYIDDLIEAFLLAAKDRRAVGKVYNVGGGRGHSLVYVAKLIIKLAHGGKLKFMSWPQDYKRVETGSYISDISRIRRELGWYPRVTIHEGIRLSLSQA